MKYDEDYSLNIKYLWAMKFLKFLKNKNPDLVNQGFRKFQII